MKKTACFKKAFSGLMICLLLVSALSGCGSKNKADDDSILAQASKASKDYVFASQNLDIGLDSYNDIEKIFFNGEKIYAKVVGDDGTKVVSFNSDGSDVKTVSLKCKDNESFDNITADKNGNIYVILSKYDYTMYEEEYIDGDESENTYVLNEASEESSENASEEVSEETTEDASAEDVSAEEIIDDDMVSDSNETEYLVAYDKEGNQLYKQDLKELYINDYFYCSGLVFSEDDGLILCYNGGIVSYSQDNGFKKLFDTEKDDKYSGQDFSPYLGSNGKVYVVNYNEYGSAQLHVLDTKTGDIAEPSNALGNNYTDSSYLPGNGYTMYISNRDGIYGFDAEKDSMTKLMDYMDSDFDINYALYNVVAISAEEFVAIIPDEDYTYHLMRLTKVPATEVKDKKVLTLGGYYINYDVRTAAVNFNRNSDEYKIKIVVYSSYNTEDDWGAGNNRFNLDIVSGNVPDIVCFRATDPVDSYINKGLFTELDSFFEKDPSVSEDNYVESVFNAYRKNGKLYQLIPKFYISTVATKTSYLDGKSTLTIDEARKLLEKTGADKDFAFGMQERNSFLENGITMSGDNYIDWENKKCSFNSDSFIGFLELAKTLPEKYKDDAWDVYEESFYRDGRSVFYNSFLTDFRSYKRIKQGTFGEDISYVGFPNDFGVNCTVIYPEAQLTISSQSSDKNGCWEFMKYFLSDEYQDSLEYYFPVSKKALQKMGEESMHKLYYMDGDKKVEYDDSYYVDDVEITIDPLTQEEVDFVMNLINSLEFAYCYNENVYKIIEEEASAYFSGQKTAKEVADIIQSRVTIYVNENS